MGSSSMAALHARLAAVMEALVLAAVAELKRLVEARVTPEFLSGKLPADTWETMVRKVQAGAAAGMLAFLCLSSR